jgi:ArsR family transcriptional regulator, arsenate/arsenite/antimonite-responsive transcriptional repressor
MSVAEASATATLFKALADPTRVRIVNMLAAAGEGVCVCDLTPELGLSQPTVSHHLKKLAEAGLLQREQRGTWAFYSLDPDALSLLQSVTTFTEVPA